MTSTLIHDDATFTLPFVPADACCDLTPDDLAQFARRNHVNRMTAIFAQVPDDFRAIDGEHPDLEDHIMSRYGEGVLDETADLELKGIDPVTLQRELENGMSHRDFQDALDGGLLDVDSFNNMPNSRTRESREQFHWGLALLAEQARSHALPRYGRSHRRFSSTSCN